MSNYQTRLNCPECKKETVAMALDDFFGPHGYAIKCNDCCCIWRQEDCDVVYQPREGVRVLKEVCESTPDS